MRTLLLAFLAACGAGNATVLRYPASDAAVLNPERGPFVDVDLVGGHDFAYVRASGATLGYAKIRLDAYRDAPLDDALLAHLRDGFAAARDAGIKLIVRFVYSDDASGQDAPIDRVLAHVHQLAPVLQENADVIAVVEAGFLGAWGEWHSSAHGLDDVMDRQLLMDALLAALPTSRSITVRSPLYKQIAYGGPVDAAHAFDGSPLARVGHLNSCFLANDTDAGTYGTPIETWKSYVADDGRFTPVGGETCAVDPPRSDCDTATTELARLHWSFLNAQYQPDVLARWRQQGCWDTIARDLGYRFELRSVSFDRDLPAGGTLHLSVRLDNTGYASLYNPRPLFVMIDGHPIETAIDPRRWAPGHAGFDLALPLPADLAPGRHRLGLWLPDADPRLRTPSRAASYAVRFVNTRWDGAENVLTDDLVVGPSVIVSR